MIRYQNSKQLRSSHTQNQNKTIIGLEVHAYLNTQSKLFCGCSTKPLAVPNSQTCPQCIGHPGSKPVLNKKAIESALKIAVALNCKVNPDFFFSRKTYFYPDMAKNFQITQYEIPVGTKGFVTLPSGKKVSIKRVHLEEDPAALIHPEGMGKSSYVLIDYNRSGLPLVEIVTEPEIDSPKEAREFLNALENIVNYLPVIKPGSVLKVDSNISLDGGARVEIKNITGFGAVEKALSFEALRQKQEKRMGKKIKQHTRAFNEETGMTVALRKKETEEDYGYIFDPDLVRVSLSNKEISNIRKEMPEMPDAKALRYQKEYGLTEYDSRVICSDFYLGNLFGEIVGSGADAKIAARVLTRELLAVLNHDSLTLKDVKVSADDLVELIKLIKEGKVSDKNTKESMINYISGDKIKPKKFLEQKNLLISKKIDLEKVVSKVISENEKAVNDYKSGNEKSFHFLAGAVMRETKGTASPKKVQSLLKKKLGE